MLHSSVLGVFSNDISHVDFKFKAKDISKRMMLTNIH